MDNVLLITVSLSGLREYLLLLMATYYIHSRQTTTVLRLKGHVIEILFKSVRYRGVDHGRKVIANALFTIFPV